MSRLLLDALINRGVVTEEELQKLANDVEERLKLKNILTEQELRETCRRLYDLRFPNPKSLADALLVHAQKEDIEQWNGTDQKQ